LVEYYRISEESPTLKLLAKLGLNEQTVTGRHDSVKCPKTRLGLLSNTNESEETKRHVRWTKVQNMMSENDELMMKKISKLEK